MYQLLALLHIVGVFGFLMAHGISAGVAYQLRSERNLERVRGLLMLSAKSYPVMYGSLLLLLVVEIILGFMGSWWGQAWMWISLFLLIAIVVLMARFGSSVYGGARKLTGLPYMERGKIQPPIEPASEAEINALLDKGNPNLLTAIGFGGIVIIAWLMMAKPF
jgi:hypothetical protein